MQKVKAERNGNFTVINNYHLHDRNISTSAKTLMTLLLSLPEDWVLSVKGVSKILNETEYAVRKMMKELEACGYLKKEQRKDENGKYTKMEYTVYELPFQETTELCEEPDTYAAPDMTEPAETEGRTEGTGRPEGYGYARENSVEKPLVEIQQAGKPRMDKPLVVTPCAAVLTLQNTNNNKILNNNPINPDPVYSDERAGKDLTDKVHAYPRREPDKSCFRQVKLPETVRRRSDKPETIPRREIYGRYRELIMGNIGYDSLKISAPYDIDMVDGLVELMLEVLCGTKPCIRISGSDYPAELVKSRFLKLRFDHMLYILDRLRENTSDVRNVKQYLLAVLFNASATIEGYYTLRVGHDLAAGLEGKTS